MIPEAIVNAATRNGKMFAVPVGIHGQNWLWMSKAALSKAGASEPTNWDDVFPVLDNTGRMVGILAKSDFLKKVDRRLILVDHNELSQAVEGADQVEILEIIDHPTLRANDNYKTAVHRALGRTLDHFESLGAGPADFSFDTGLPREKVCVQDWRSRATSTTSSSDSAFTTETPTPCRPPDVA